MIKKEFPIFENNATLAYLDSAATLQKPGYVISGVQQYLAHDYANIHRGRYGLSERSEEMYWRARQKTAAWIGAKPDEVIFTSSSTDSVNLLAQSLEVSGRIKKDDTIVLCEADHHADIVPWQMLAKRCGCTIERVGVTDTGKIDLNALQGLFANGNKRLFACHMLSNVLGVINDIKKIREICGDDTLLVVDGSQALPHIAVDLTEIGCDFFFFTGHKLGALTGVGVLRGKQQHLQALTPSRGGGGSIESVHKDGFSLLGSPDKFEPGTPNLVGVASLLYAFEWMESVGQSKAGFYQLLKSHEDALIRYSIERFATLSSLGVRLLGGKEDKVGVFSFTLPEGKGVHGLGQYMATQDIAIRCGGQCTHPYHKSLGHEAGSCRISYWLYTTMDDLEKFFDELEKYLQ